MRALTTLATIALLCVGILAQQKPAPTPIKTTVAALIENPDKFHRKMVQVEGEVDDLKKKTSRIGNPYTTFKLDSGGKQVVVFSYGHLNIQEDDAVIVVGKFYKERRVGRSTFKNEIDASQKEGGSVRKKE
jgi:queuine/archaeosine tRNA-ribosyltransferase